MQTQMCCQGYLFMCREKEEPTDLEVFNVAQVDALPVTAQQLGQATRSDPILSSLAVHEN